MGLLELTGHIDVSQLAPQGSSDADTTKIAVTTSDAAFRFRADAGASWQVTRAFAGATVKGRVSKAVIDTQGRVTVRLQGVDAPELHYRPSAVLKKGQQSEEQRTKFLRWNLDFRQPFAETGTRALRTFLDSLGRDPLPASCARMSRNPRTCTGGSWATSTSASTARSAASTPGSSSKAGRCRRFTTRCLRPRCRDRHSHHGGGARPRERRRHLALARRQRSRVRLEPPVSPQGHRGRAGRGLGRAPEAVPEVTTWMVNRRAQMFTGSFTKFLEAQSDPSHPRAFIYEDLR